MNEDFLKNYQIQKHGSSSYVNIEEKVWLLVKKYSLCKTDEDKNVVFSQE
jgi:hypothetical protein